MTKEKEMKLPKLTDPFSYVDGGVKSLLDSAMSVNGAYIGAPRTASGLVLRKGAKASFDPSNAFNAELAAYEAHYKSYYDSSSVGRHIGTLLSGGKETYLDCGIDGIHLSQEPPATGNSSVYASICGKASAHFNQFLIDSFYQANTDEALRKCAAVILEGVATFDSVVMEGEISRGDLASWVGSDPASNGASPFATAGKAYSNWSGESDRPFRNIPALLDPGYTLVMCVAPTVGNGTGSVWTDPWTFTILKFKLRVPTRLCNLVIKSQPIGDSSWMQTELMLWFESWNFSGSPSSPTPGISGSAAPYSTGAKRIDAHSTFGPALGAIMTQTHASVVPTEPANFSGLTVPTEKWNFPATYNATGSLAGLKTLAYHGVHMIEDFTARVNVPATLEEWTGSGVRNRLFYTSACYNHAKVLIGCDLTSNRIVDVRYQLSSLPSPSLLSGELQRADVLQSYVTKVTSAKVAEVLAAVESQSSEDLTAMRTEMEANSRTFYGGLWQEPAVPPPAVLSRTQVQQTALDAGDDMSPKVFVPKDEDDATSTDLTYKQADNLCSAFRGDLRRRAIVVVGPTANYVGETLAPFAVIVGGVSRFVHPVDKSELDDEQLTQVFAALQQGQAIVFDSMNDPLAIAYVSDPRPNYPDVWDMVCIEVFGKSYGSITRNSSSSGASSSEWTATGQLNDSGFLKHFSEWTPEFWLTTCGTKSWRIETILGTLLTNPYGVGSLTQSTIEGMNGLDPS